MAVVLKFVWDVAADGPHSKLFHVPAGNDYYIDALGDDLDLMKLVGDSYTSSSYKHVRCLGTSSCSLVLNQ
jgi:hypothetical protein